MVLSRFGEVCYCCSLTVLPGPAWILLIYALHTNLCTSVDLWREMSWPILSFEFELQRFSSVQPLGLKDYILGSSPGRLAAAVATYCPSRPLQFELTPSPKLCDRADEKRCTYVRNSPARIPRSIDGVSCQGCGNQSLPNALSSMLPSQMPSSAVVATETATRRDTTRFHSWLSPP